MSDNAEVLADLNFGAVDSESEPDLDQVYLRTGDFERFIGPARTELILGPKGSGKSALFQLFDRHEQTVRGWSGERLADVLLQPAVGMRDLSDLAGGELTRVLLKDDLDFERLWKAYIGWKAAAAVARAKLPATGRLKQFQRSNGMRRDWRIGPLLRRAWSAVMSDAVPGSLKVSLFGAGVEVGGSKSTPWDMSEVLRLANLTAGQEGKTIWILFDNLDELLSTHPKRRLEALNALFTVCNQLRVSYTRIQPRIFLRTDIWEDIAFNNKSHWVGKEMRLSWSDEQLLRLLLKRATSSAAVRAYIQQVIPKLTGQQAVDDMSGAELRATFFLLFEPNIENDKTGDAWRWMTARSADGHGQALPRELITFANLAVQIQQESRDATDGPLVGRKAIRDAYPEVSRLRCETFLAEFPELRLHFARFNARTSPRFHRAELDRLMSGLNPSGNAMIDALCDTGVLKPIDGHRETAQQFDVPLLYRPGLKLRLRGGR